MTHTAPEPSDAGSVALPTGSPGRHPIAMRAMVGAGFLLVLLLWLASGIDLLVRYEQYQTRAAQAWEGFNRSEQALANVRVNMLIGAINVRDALLDTDPGNVEGYRVSLRENRAATIEALDELAQAVPSAQQDSLAGLRAAVEDYWELTVPLLEADLPQQPGEIRRLLNTAVLPRRQLGVNISDQIRVVNRAAFETRQQEVLAMAEESQRRAWLTGTIALVLSLLVVVVVAVYVGRLESQVRVQLAKDVENTRNLQALSARLVRAQEEERRLIARELHDEVGQALTAVKLELAAAQRGKDPLRLAQALTEVKSIADDALQTVRNLSQLLRPPMLDELGLPETLTWYLKGFSTRTGIRTELRQVNKLARASPEIETCIYRVVQEATTNVARHARASTCRITVQQLSASILVTVEDDGCGFDTGALADRPAKGMGLLGMTERVTGFGGQMHIESQEDRGTRVTVELPILVAADTDAAPAPAAEPSVPSLEKGELSASNYAR
ncbi:MAG: sensor histidine kinase [Acidobacteriota bacterium]